MTRIRRGGERGSRRRRRRSISDTQTADGYACPAVDRTLEFDFHAYPREGSGRQLSGRSTFRGGRSFSEQGPTLSRRARSSTRTPWRTPDGMAYNPPHGRRRDPLPDLGRSAATVCFSSRYTLLRLEHLVWNRDALRPFAWTQIAKAFLYGLQFDASAHLHPLRAPPSAGARPGAAAAAPAPAPGRGGPLLRPATAVRRPQRRGPGADELRRSPRHARHAAARARGPGQVPLLRPAVRKDLDRQRRAAGVPRGGLPVVVPALAAGRRRRGCRAPPQPGPAAAVGTAPCPVAAGPRRWRCWRCSSTCSPSAASSRNR